MKNEIKIGLALDDYKLKNKDDWWRKCLKGTPQGRQIEKHYEFVREEIGPGITKNTVMCYRYYRLKGSA